MEMTLDKREDGVTCVHLSGRLDAAGSDHIDVPFTAATAAQGHNTLVDMGGVEFMASMGIRMLISSAKALHTKGAKMVLFGARPMVANVIEQAALDQIIPVAATEAQALALL